MPSYILGNKRWELVYDKVDPESDGYCDPPDKPFKKITIRPSLKRNPKYLLEILIHECLHAEGWPLDEDFIAQAAHDIAKVLWSQGFRK